MNNAKEVMLFWLFNWPVLFTFGIMLVVVGLTIFKGMFYCICKVKNIEYISVFPKAKSSPDREYFISSIVDWSIYMSMGLSLSVLAGEYYKIGWALHGIIWPLGILRAWHIAHKTAELAEINEL